MFFLWWWRRRITGRSYYHTRTAHWYHPRHHNHANICLNGKFFFPLNLFCVRIKANENKSKNEQIYMRTSKKERAREQNKQKGSFLLFLFLEDVPDKCDLSPWFAAYVSLPSAFVLLYRLRICKLLVMIRTHVGCGIFIRW